MTSTPPKHNIDEWIMFNRKVPRTVYDIVPTRGRINGIIYDQWGMHYRITFMQQDGDKVNPNAVAVVDPKDILEEEK